jgi:hypothetical protein
LLISKIRQTRQNFFDPAYRAEVLRKRVGFGAIRLDLP